MINELFSPSFVATFISPPCVFRMIYPLPFIFNKLTLNTHRETTVLLWLRIEMQRDTTATKTCIFL